MGAQALTNHSGSTSSMIVSPRTLRFGASSVTQRAVHPLADPKAGRKERTARVLADLARGSESEAVALARCRRDQRKRSFAATGGAGYRVGTGRVTTAAHRSISTRRWSNRSLRA